MTCIAASVVFDDEVEVCVKSALQGLESGPLLLAQAVTMFARVSSRSSPSQFGGGDCEAHCSAVGRKLDARPLTEKSALEATATRL